MSQRLSNTFDLKPDGEIIPRELRREQSGKEIENEFRGWCVLEKVLEGAKIRPTRAIALAYARTRAELSALEDELYYSPEGLDWSECISRALVEIPYGGYIYEVENEVGA